MRWLRRSSRARDAAAPTDETFLRSLGADERARLERSLPHSMVGPPRLVANMDAVAYVVREQIPGAIVECGVWRGGSVLAMVLTLQDLGVSDRDVYLFDTFTGMPEPSELETSRFAEPAHETWAAAQASGRIAWEEAFGPQGYDLDGVKRLLDATGYPEGRLHYVIGRVEDTVPEAAPDRVAVLRLDTDWYASTSHELRHLYPRLSEGGVLIIDDYGHWDGCRKAVDEYFGAHPGVLLTRIDYSARLAIKRYQRTRRSQPDGLWLNRNRRERR